MDFHDADEIIPRLWIGNANASMDNRFIRNNKITTIFNCTKDLPFNPIVQRKFRIPVDDDLSDHEIRNLSLWSFEIVYTMMKEYFSGNTILVHCAAGMQRSAASVAMFIIGITNKSPKDVVKFIKTKRSIAFTPAVNFERAIHKFDSDYKNTVIPIISHNQ